MNLPTAEPSQVFLDVRKAYRLLHDYQRMALDATNYIGKQLGLPYVGGWPKFSDASPKAGKGELDYWSWDWLNLVLYECHFSKVPMGTPGLKFSVLLISDTGYFCSEQESAEQTNVSDFLAVEQSRTMVGFIISGKEWPHPAFLENKVQMKTFIETRGTLPSEYGAAGVIGKCYDFDRLVNQQETDALLRELIAFANGAGIPLKVVSHKLTSKT
jgi:hypothetical protein